MDSDNHLVLLTFSDTGHRFGVIAPGDLNECLIKLLDGDFGTYFGWDSLDECADDDGLVEGDLILELECTDDDLVNLVGLAEREIRNRIRSILQGDENRNIPWYSFEPSMRHYADSRNTGSEPGGHYGDMDVDMDVDDTGYFGGDEDYDDTLPEQPGAPSLFDQMGTFERALAAVNRWNYTHCAPPWEETESPGSCI